MPKNHQFGNSDSSRENLPAGTIRLETLLPPQNASQPEECVPLFLKIVRRLREIHTAGLFHHELSPGNIRLKGEAVELDTCAPPPAQATLQIRNAKYTAPELFVSQVAPDEAGHICSDIYVLGFLFYEFLVGRSEMERQFSQFSNIGKHLQWMRWHADPAMKLKPLESVAPACPKPLASLIERMLQKEPAKRIRTFEEVEANLSTVGVRLDRTEAIPITSRLLPPPKRNFDRGRKALGVAVITGVLLTAAFWAAHNNWPAVRRGFSFASGFWQTHIAGAPKLPLASRVSTRPVLLETPTGDMVLVPEGDFVMGNDSVPDEAPAHTVHLAAFYIDRLEVSNRYYRSFCLKTHRTLPAAPPGNAEYFSNDNLPVVGATQQDAQEFCGSAGKHLPSEAEWEKAARGNEPSTPVWGNWKMPGLANLKGAAGGRPMAVGSFPSDVSPFGVLDMAG
ncbi:MAG: SUMF1/EgtB/PvdO family nonheme iron enzyme, partial [Acidobacteriia bacterium]|nr:SUMF1/EgtB/PvdO family nonheme iron enzyme [Terriglobia bacterium]